MFRGFCDLCSGVYDSILESAAYKTVQNISKWKYRVFRLLTEHLPGSYEAARSEYKNLPTLRTLTEPLHF